MHETEERTRQTQPSRVAPAERRGILSWPIAVGVVVRAHHQDRPGDFRQRGEIGQLVGRRDQDEV